jgi:soluble lytic murein transglycosylase-like protein
LAEEEDPEGMHTTKKWLMTPALVALFSVSSVMPAFCASEYGNASNQSYRPVPVAVQPSLHQMSTYQAGYRPASGQPFGPITDISREQQNETALTQFILGYNKKLTWEQANMMAEAIMAFSKYYRVDFRLVTGVIAVESSFRTDAISRSGAIGLGQLKPKTAQWLGVGNPFDPVENISGMARYLAYLISKYGGSLDHAVSAYYQGPGTVDREGISENAKEYLYRVNNVLSRM